MNEPQEFDLFGDPIVLKTKTVKPKEPEPEPVPQAPEQTERTQQAKTLLDFLIAGGAITAVEALECLGIASFHRRLTDLKEVGWLIDSKWIEVPTRYGNGKTKVKQYTLNQTKIGELL